MAPATRTRTRKYSIDTGKEQYFTVPGHVEEIAVEADGATGGGGSSTSEGGLGGRVSAVIAVKPGEQLALFVGGQGLFGESSSGKGGFNGGGLSPGYSYGGGGASDVRENGDKLSDRVIVAAGGGGASGGYSASGGAGGGKVGGSGSGQVRGAGGGGGGTHQSGVPAAKVPMARGIPANPELTANSVVAAAAVRAATDSTEAYPGLAVAAAITEAAAAVVAPGAWIQASTLTAAAVAVAPLTLRKARRTSRSSVGAQQLVTARSLSPGNSQPSSSY